MRILTIASSYPSKATPWSGVFVHSLMRAFQARSAEVNVIAPASYTSLFKIDSRFKMPDLYQHHDGISIYRPRFFSFSNLPLPWGGTTWRWMVNRYINATIDTLPKVMITPDICYAHFLYPAGIAAIRIAEELDIPCVLSLGESRYSLYEKNYGHEKIRSLIAMFDGIITVNHQLKERCISRYNVSGERIIVLPNGVDTSKFYPRERMVARNRLGLPQDKVIIVMIGQFSENKGPLRVMEAIRTLRAVRAVFLGDGPQKPVGNQVLFAGRVSHDHVPLWLSAADMFVLPTISEGCCNGILESLACGLPVISSDCSFNHTILNKSISILVDPMDIRGLKKAIETLCDDQEKRDRMSVAARKRALKYSLSERAEKILDWMNRHVIHT